MLNERLGLGLVCAPRGGRARDAPAEHLAEAGGHRRPHLARRARCECRGERGRRRRAMRGPPPPPAEPPRAEWAVACAVGALRSGVRRARRGGRRALDGRRAAGDAARLEARRGRASRGVGRSGSLLGQSRRVQLVVLGCDVLPEECDELGGGVAAVVGRPQRADDAEANAHLPERLLNRGVRERA